MFGIQGGKTPQVSCYAATNTPHKQYPKAAAALHNTQQLAASTPKAQKTVARSAFRQYTCDANRRENIDDDAFGQYCVIFSNAR